MKIWRGQADHSHWQTAFTARERGAAWLAIGGASLAFGWIKWSRPEKPPFTGKWAWLMEWAHESLGTKGPAVVFMTVGAVFSLCGAIAWWRK